MSGNETMECVDATETAEAMAAQEALEKKKRRGGIVLLLFLAAAAAAGISFGVRFAMRSANYLITDNARVTTTLIAVMPTAPGALERFALFEGRRIEENEILGWVENSEPMRSPVNGIVISSNAVQNQVVAPMSPIAVIADTSNLHVQANIEETDIARIRVGQPATVTIDPFGNREFAGYVAEIGHVTTAELAGTALFFNTGGNFTRVTHLIPVRINVIDDVSLDSLIGVNARVQISLRQRDGLVINSATPRNGNSPNGITARGTVESVQRRSVYGTLGSMVERVYVETGDRVDEGCTLAVLDTADLNVQLANAEASLRVAEIQIATAEHNHRMLRALHGAGGIPNNDLRQAEFALQSAIAFSRQAQAQVDATRIALERSIIRSPIDGTVTAVVAREGSAGMGLLFVVEDTDNLRVMTSFRESDLSLVETGMEVTITSDATGNAEYAGVINRIHPTATAIASVAEFEAEVLVTSEDTSLRIGTSARLDIILY